MLHLKLHNLCNSI